MQTLDHPNVIKLVNFHESSQYYFIILELAPGGELFHQIVRLTYFSEELSRHVIKQVADALLYLHEIAGVVHRCVCCNIRPRCNANLVTETSNPKTCYSILRRSFRLKVPSPRQKVMKTKKTRESLFQVLEPAKLVLSNSPTLV